MCYLQSTLGHRLIGFVGNKPCDMQAHLFADADFAGDPEAQRSTSGLHLALRGPATGFPLTGASKRQTCVSHSTPEAEIVAADFALRTSGIPAQQLLERHLRTTSWTRFPRGKPSNDTRVPNWQKPDHEASWSHASR